jgi:hypothetical protein
MFPMETAETILNRKKVRNYCGGAADRIFSDVTRLPQGFWATRLEHRVGK